ncbi:uncharacterized protein LOC113302136 isoform X2 [Papaver somniferum]|uniref:uncharacterized protein LOC113302136 isoform X2 n=1 Tax=Papaver somniferum TaxID=3469 RepID=UPI000E6F51AD|nr:uncharacterized protein LOC113302136 isoform X2 [Papaver somniferum]
MKKFLEVVFDERIEYKKGLILDVKIRWNSIFLMLDSAEKYEKSFIRLARSDKAFRERLIFDIPDEPEMGVNIDAIESTDVPDEYESTSSYYDAPEEPVAGRRKAKKKKPRVHAPEKYDWANARVLVQFLQVFFEATVEFSGSTYVTSHTFLAEICDVRGELYEWKKAHYDPHLSHMGEKMLLKYNKYWGVGSVLASSESVGETGGIPSQESSSSSSTLHRKKDISPTEKSVKTSCLQWRILKSQRWKDTYRSRFNHQQKTRKKVQSLIY